MLKTRFTRTRIAISRNSAITPPTAAVLACYPRVAMAQE